MEGVGDQELRTGGILDSEQGKGIRESEKGGRHWDFIKWGQDMAPQAEPIQANLEGDEGTLLQIQVSSVPRRGQSILYSIAAYFILKKSNKGFLLSLF